MSTFKEQAVIYVNKKGFKNGDHNFLNIKSDDIEFNALAAGCVMENIEESLGLITGQVVEAKKELQKVVNDMLSMKDNLYPCFKEVLENVRINRMAIVEDIKTQISVLREMRSFMLEASFEKEVERIEKLVSICKELKKLKDDGTLDIISDIAVRMATHIESRDLK